MTKFSGAFTLQAQMQNAAASTWARAPGAPTIGTASVTNATTASITFTPPTDLGFGPVTYIAVSNPGGIVGTSATSPVSVSGLTTGTSYTFTVDASTPGGAGPSSAASNSITMIIQGQEAYTTAGTYTWIAPAGVTSVSVVAVGGGRSPSSSLTGGGGGALSYTNNISVTPGESLTVRVAPPTGSCAPISSFLKRSSTSLVEAGSAATSGGTGGTVIVGTGGSGGSATSFYPGGGAGGYAGNGGNGSCSGGAGAGGAGAGGGAAGSGGGGGGGGVGILGQGSNGVGGAYGPTIGGGGGGGSGGTNGGSAGNGNGGSGGTYGGGGAAGCNNRGTGGGGAVRIIWPGNTRSFPSTCTGNL